MNIEIVQTIDQAFDMSYVRNSGSEYMTHDTRHITDREQAKWFLESYLPNAMQGLTYGFVGYHETSPVAYGLVNWVQEDYWLTGVIHNKYRGAGYGEQLFRHLSEFTLKMANRAMLDVLSTNERAIALYQKLGYQALTETNGVIVMCLDRGDYEPQPANI